MSAKNYALIDAGGNVLNVVVCEPSRIRRLCVELGADGYIRRPDENLGGKLKMLEPGAKLGGYSIAGKKVKNPDSVTLRGQSDAVAPVELPGDTPGEE